MQAITSFALYGFPESHAASFALIAYASAYLKCHYLAAFTAAILNNQPMGFYQPFTIIKDAQRHGLKVKPIDVTCSDWLCTIEEETEGGDAEMGRRGDGEKGRRGDRETRREVEATRVTSLTCLPSPIPSPHLPISPSRVSVSPHLPFSPSPRPASPFSASPLPPFPCLPPVSPPALVLRLGLRYVKGLSEASGRAIESERKKSPFLSFDDLRNRVPELRKDELRKLASVGALNFIQDQGIQSPKSNVQSPKHRQRNRHWTLDVGHWTGKTREQIVATLSGKWNALLVPPVLCIKSCMNLIASRLWPQ